MKQYLPCSEQHSEEIKERARKVVATSVPKDEVRQMLDMLGLL